MSLLPTTHSRTLASRWILLALVLGAPLASRAQGATGTLQGTVQGSTQSSSTLVPLSYAVVGLPTLALERFTDGAGRFRLGELAPGRYEVVVRRIGYAPRTQTVQIVADRVTRLDVQLAVIPVRIASLTVRALARCTSPGVPDASAEPAVATLVALLRENADRYRLLASQYPFAYQHVRSLLLVNDDHEPATAVHVQLVDSIDARSAARAEYRAGRVVQRQRFRGGLDEYSMALPTIMDLADNAFARAHCFAYGGREEKDGETWLRLDVRAADKINSPDVHGTFFLDSASAQLRRMDLELSRPDKLPSQLQHIEQVRVRTRFREIAPGLSIVDDICAVNRPKRKSALEPMELAAELQVLSAYAFREPPPDVSLAGRFETPAWRRGDMLPRSALWCVE